MIYIRIRLETTNRHIEANLSRKECCKKALSTNHIASERQGIGHGSCTGNGQATRLAEPAGKLPKPESGQKAVASAVERETPRRCDDFVYAGKTA